MSIMNPFQYTSRTYNTLLQDINNDSELLDKPDWFKKMIAGIGDTASMWLNAAANNAYLGTAFSRREVIELARLIGYEAATQQPATGTLIFYLNSTVSFPYAIARADLAALSESTLDVAAQRYEARSSATATAFSETFTANDTTDLLTVARDYTTGEMVRLTTTGTLPAGLSIATNYYVIRVSATTIRLATTAQNAYNGTYIDITDTGTGTHTAALYSIQVTVYQQTTTEQYEIGISDGSEEWQEYDLADEDVLLDTEVIEINSVTWSRVSTFVDSLSTDTHYRLIYNSDQTSFIQFGNGTYGAIPGNFSVLGNYYHGGGVDGNIATLNKVSLYAGSDTGIIGVSNATAMSGGSDPESINSIKRIAPILLKAQERFVTAEDGEALMIASGGISQAQVNPNVYGVLSAQCVAIADGGGNPSTAKKNAMQADLIARSVLSSMDVRVEDTTITTQNVTIQIKVVDGFVWADIQDYVDLACQLFFSETGLEIQELYEDSGIAAAVTLINTVFSTSFGTADYDQITELITKLQPRTIGEVDIQEIDLLSYVDQNVTGVLYPTITAPTFPIAIADNEITTIGTVTSTEIP